MARHNFNERTEITGVFVREKNVFDTPGKPRVIVGTLANGTKIKGNANERELVPGLTYVFSGSWYVHETWGKQFNFNSFIQMAPSDEDSIVAYLKQVRGIGDRYASEIYRKFGQDSIAKLKTSPEEVASCFPRLPVTLFTEAASLLKSREGTEKAKLEITKLLAGFSIPRSLIETLIDKLGVGAADAIRKNPYLLRKYKGVGFNRADILYQSLNKDPVAIVRQVECVLHAIESEREGHTWVEKEALRAKLSAAISSASERLEDVLKACDGTNKEYEKLEQYTDSNGRVYVTTAKMAAEEEWLARDIARRCRTPCKYWPDPSRVKQISDHQREQLSIAITRESSIAIISGGPGTGKTYLASRVIAEFVSKNFGVEEICAVAPTGKAAVRLSGVLATHGIKLRAKTVHSTLGFGLDEDGELSFAYSEEKPLPFKLFVIDEPSMITTSLLWSLFAAIPQNAMILIVGDPYQLSPVGRGAPFRDMTVSDSPIPHGHLTEIQRNSGLIAKVCAMVRDESRYDAPSKFDLENGGNLVHIECATESQQIDALSRSLRSLITQGRDVVWEVQVITALNAKTQVSRRPLNALMQRMLNEKSPVIEGSVFRNGDKVINLENAWIKSLGYNDQANESNEVYVANGEQGEVFGSEARRFNVSLSAPDREVQVFKGKSEKDENGDDESSTDSGCKWDLGYAISGHKSQGSEWQITFIMIDQSMGAKLVCSREWVYTVLSRARSQCVTIGKKHVIDGFCKQTNIWRRKTFLRERIDIAYQNEVELSLDDEINEEHGGRSNGKVGEKPSDPKGEVPVRDSTL